MKDENFTTVSNENILGVNYDEETFAFSKKELKSSEKISILEIGQYALHAKKAMNFFLIKLNNNFSIFA